MVRFGSCCPMPGELTRDRGREQHGNADPENEWHLS
jgi:hypothetical protein